MAVQLVSLLVALGALLIGVLVGGPMGWGVACGLLLGAAVSGFAAGLLRAKARSRPEHAFNAFIIGFMIKLGALFAVGLAYLVVPDLTERLDPKGLLLAYAASAVVLLAVGIGTARRELGFGTTGS
jgi:hypothetical protein